jgi:hypothetical protein
VTFARYSFVKDALKASYVEMKKKDAKWTKENSFLTSELENVTQVRKTPSWPRSWANFSLL